MKGSRRFLGSVSAILILLLVFAPAAFAGQPHFNSFTFSIGSSLDFLGVIVGLGNENSLVKMTATGSVTAICENKGGGQAPGRNDISVEVEQTVTAFVDENGRATVLVEAPDPTSPGFEPSPNEKEAGCPNGKWTVVGIQDHSTNWTAAHIQVFDEAGIVQIDLLFTCTTFFDENGVGVSVTCVEV